MDSLIVMRRILRKTQLEPKFINPKKSKKVLPKLGPIPSGPNANEPTISFVKLYKEACVQNARRAACVHVHTQTRAHSAERVCEASSTRVHTSRPSSELLSLDWPLAERSVTRVHVNSSATCSATSLVTQYGRRPGCTVLPPSSVARADLKLDLDYDTRSKNSGFY